MSTTYEPATVNRVAGYFAQPLPEIPDHDFDRQALYTESIMQAVLAMRELLSCGGKAIVLKAAQELFTLERTRLRHHRNVSGCRDKMIPKWQSDREDQECFEDAGPPSAAQLESEAFELHAKEAQAELRKAEEAKPASERKHVHTSAGRTAVARYLKRWNVTARSIPAGGFWKEYVQRPVPPKEVHRKPKPAEPPQRLGGWIDFPRG